MLEPAEMVLLELYLESILKEKPSEYAYTDEIHIRNLLKTSE